MRKFLILLLACAMLFTFAACKGSGEQEHEHVHEEEHEHVHEEEHEHVHEEGEEAHAFIEVGGVHMHTTSDDVEGLPEGVTYNDGVLTLENVDISVDSESAAISVQGMDIVVVLKGQNKLSGKFGIYTMGNLTIEGDGALNADSEYCGVFANGNIAFNGGQITSKATLEKSYGIVSTQGITVSGGRIEAEALTSAIAIDVESGSTELLKLENGMSITEGGAPYCADYDSEGDARAIICISEAEFTVVDFTPIGTSTRAVIE